MSPANPRIDTIDWSLLEALQEDGRLGIAALGRRLGLSSTATAERLARLREIGVIREIVAVVDPASIGLVLTAFVRVQPHERGGAALLATVGACSYVREAHHITGEDCYLLRVVARDMLHLEEITAAIGAHGRTTTSLVYSSRVQGRPVDRALLADTSPQ